MHDKHTWSPLQISQKGKGKNKTSFGLKSTKGMSAVSKLHGCKFPGSSCCTQTETKGNSPCQVIYWHLLISSLSSSAHVAKWLGAVLSTLQYLSQGQGKEKGKHIWQQKYNNFQASKLYGCKFPGSSCHTQTETNGNVPQFTNYICFWECFSDKSLRYVQIKNDNNNNKK